MRLLNNCCPGGQAADSDGLSAGRWAGRQWAQSLLTFCFNLFADSIFLQSIQPTFFNFHTWFFQGPCFHVLPCSFQLVPNFLVKNAFFGDRYLFIFIFSQISVYIL